MWKTKQTGQHQRVISTQSDVYYPGIRQRTGHPSSFPLLATAFPTYCENTSVFLMSMISLREPFASRIWTDYGGCWVHSKRVLDKGSEIIAVLKEFGYVGIELDTGCGIDHVFVIIDGGSTVWRFESYIGFHEPCLVMWPDWDTDMKELLSGDSKVWNRVFDVDVSFEAGKILEPVIFLAK